MASLKIYNIEGKVVEEHTVPLAFEPRESDADVLARAINRQLANARHNYAKAKTKGEVSGSNSKPWRQKGTGRARHGSHRSPIWKGGGITFGPTGLQNFSQNMNRKERRRAMQVALMNKIIENSFIVVDGLKLDEPSTKEGAKIMGKLPVKDARTLFLAGDEEDMLFLSFRNMAKVECLPSERVNGFSLVKSEKVLATRKAYEYIEKVWLS
jgi:large subunit ribosomal protein L4